MITISIHALLAESDSRHTTTTHNDTNFYPRSPCGERRHVNAANFHLLGISIHALLAESDPFSRSGPMMRRYFYPRSPCGERREYWVGGYGTANNFYPRSPCGERRWLRCWQLAARDISIHALLAESDVDEIPYQREIHQFLSTLSLRRATVVIPRPPIMIPISIHALLAESDDTSMPPTFIFWAFLSTLSLRRATHFRGPAL